jgi:site-specific recombinase XerD
LTQFLGYLREADIIAGPAVAVSDHPRDQILREYADYLNDPRGLKQLTIDRYLPVARRFLKARVDAECLGLDQLQVQDITGFLLADSPKDGSSCAQLTAGVLRSFLGFLTQAGKVATNLAVSVPSVANGRWSGVPRFLEPAQVEQLLNSCDQSCPLGRRDYAVLLLVARLGLRAGEVVDSNLEHINWEAGELYIRGKSAREDRLPLLPEVGRAIAAYLKQDRPQSPCRRVFLRLQAPHQGFVSASAIAHIVRCALTRAQLDPIQKGAHLLRRSLATQMLRQGATLTQIGQILRHQRSQTTEIYAKVDVVALRALVQPWPGGAQ